MSLTVLAIDDDPHTRELIAAILELTGCRVLIAEDGAAGLRLAERHRPDAILLDLSMPGMDGYEVCRALADRPATQRIPVIFVTSSDDPGLNRRAYALGAFACVPKPFRREALVSTIQAVVRAAGPAGPPRAG
ncbi:MAG: PleD family two-component system response regulator [Candidatus Methylomirabilales bacterium]